MPISQCFQVVAILKLKIHLQKKKRKKKESYSLRQRGTHTAEITRFQYPFFSLFLFLMPANPIKAKNPTQSLYRQFVSTTNPVDFKHELTCVLYEEKHQCVCVCATKKGFVKKKKKN